METINGINILAIESKPENLMTLGEVVREALPQAVVLTALDGPEGIELAAVEEPDVILLDIGMFGFEVCHRLKADERLKNIPVVFLTTADTTAANRVNALEAGTDGFLCKPLEAAELIALIRAIARRRSVNQFHRELLDKLPVSVVVVDPGSCKIVEDNEKVFESSVGLKSDISTNQTPDSCAVQSDRSSPGEAAELEALRDSKIHYRQLLESPKDGILILDAGNGMVIDVNPYLLDLLGYSRTEVLWKKVWELGFIEDVVANEGHFAELRQTKYARYDNLALKGLDGRLHEVELILNVYQEDSHEVIQCNIRDISERKRAEEALRISEWLLRSTLDGLSAHIAVLDDQGEIVLTNKAYRDFAERNGIEPGAVSERTNYLTVCDTASGEHSQEAGPFAEAIREVLSGKRRYFELEYPCHSPDEKRWFVGRVMPIQSKGHRRVVVAHENITERRRAEEMMQEDRERLEYVLSATRTGIDIIDSEFNLHFVDKGWQKVYGDPTGRKCYEYFHGFSEPCWGCGIIKALETKQVVVTEGVLRRENNRPIEARYIPFQDAKGKWFFSVINIDITDRKRSEQVLRESEERFMKVLYSSEDAILLIGENKFIECNETTARMLGYPTRKEFLKTHPSELSPPRQPDGRESFEKAEEMIRLANKRGFHRFEWMHRRANGEDFPVEVSLTPIVYQGESLLYCIWRDLTEQKQAKAQMQQMELDLRHSQKLEAVGQLAAGIAHEINTPAQFVGDSIGFLKEVFEDMDRLVEVYRHVVDALEAGGTNQNLVAQIRATEEEVDLEYLLTNVPASLERAIDGIGRISSIVLAMKEFAHPAQRNQSRADLKEAISTTLTVARNEYKYVADVETDFGELPAVMCHLGDLNQVFLNLIVNAAHAIADVVGNTNTRGMISIRTRTEGEYVRIDISDSGKGIPEAIRDRVFDPFFTTKPIGKGTGQGLAIARSIIVDKHSGSLTFESDIGHGTKFTIRLPIEGAKKFGEGSLS